LDAVSAEVEVINAVNTVVFYEDEVQGYNTDAVGTATALESFADVPLEGVRAFVYGMRGVRWTVCGACNQRERHGKGKRELYPMREMHVGLSCGEVRVDYRV